jgi:hypothetical protein
MVWILMGSCLIGMLFYFKKKNGCSFTTYKY